MAFRFGLTFLLSIGRDNYVTPMVSITEYFDLFVNVIARVAASSSRLPVLIFFLTLLRIVTPGFLIRNSRYAILVIFILAAIVTPTPDVFNLMLFAMPDVPACSSSAYSPVTCSCCTAKGAVPVAKRAC